MSRTARAHSRRRCEHGPIQHWQGRGKIWNAAAIEDSGHVGREPSGNANEDANWIHDDLVEPQSPASAEWGSQRTPPPRTLLAVGTLPRGEFSYDALLSSPAASFLSRLSASTSPATTVLRSIGHREHRPCGSGIKMPQRLARHAYVRIMDENDHKPQA